MAVHVGIGLFTGQVPPGSGRTYAQEHRETLDLARLAETLGFDSAWVSEHHGAGDGYFPSLLTVLGAMAAVTDRILLGTGVVLTPFHDPLRLAEDAATVDLLSDGRLILGLGLGWREEEFRMFGIPMAERVSRTVDAIEVLRRAWTGRRFSYTGKTVSLEEVLVTPPPVQDPGPPIYLGGSVEAAIRRAGRLADGYIRTRGAGLEAMRRDLATAEDAARAAGRDPEALGFAQLQNAFVWDGAGGQTAWDVVSPYVRHQLGVYGGWAQGSDTPGHDFFYSPPDEEAMRRMTPAGTPDEITRVLRPMVEAFAGRRHFHLVVRLQYPGMPMDIAARAVELFAEQVLPALKGA
jgi:probable F420-dependent oxidoreductase